MIRRLLLLVLFCLSVSPLRAVSTTLVISQVYGAGGNSGATYNADYVELFNLSGSTISLNGYAIQYISAGGTAQSGLIALPNVSLAPGQHYLIAATAGTNGAALPATPDDVVPNTPSSGAIAFAAAAGKVFLTNTVSPLTLASSTTCSDPSIIDMIGYGTASCWEGTAAAPAPSTTVVDIRGNNGCTDTDNNASDFTTGAPAPRNLSSPATPCVALTPQPLALSASISPAGVYTGSIALLTATVTPGTLPASTGIVVSADLSGLGGSATQPLFDDGTHGDLKAGDGIYTYALTISGSQAVKAYTVNFKATDSQLRTANSTGSFSVLLTTPDFQLSVANTSILANASTPRGQTTVSVTMVQGFNQPVALTCSGLPAGATCRFTPATLSATGTSTLSIAIDGATASLHRELLRRGVTFAALLGLPLLFLNRNRRLMRGVLGIFLLGAMLIGVSGCSTSTNTAPGSTAITVTGTGGGITHTATITLTAQ